VGSPNFKSLGQKLVNSWEERAKAVLQLGVRMGRCVFAFEYTNGTRNLNWTQAQDTCRDPLCLGAGTPTLSLNRQKGEMGAAHRAGRADGQDCLIPHLGTRVSQSESNEDPLKWRGGPVCQEQWHSSQKRGSSRGQDSPKAGFNKGLWIWL